MADSQRFVGLEPDGSVPVTIVAGGTGGGAVTQATTPWIVAGQGTAGAAATGVVTVQGIVSGTAVPISGTVTAAQATATSLKAEVIGAGTAGTANAGVLTVQGIASMTPVQVSQTTASNLNAQAVGNIAHDGADSGNPIKVGNKAVSFGTNPTEVAANDRTDAYATLAGIPFVLPGHPNVITRRDNYTDAQTNTALITVSGGAKIVVLSCTIVCDAANTVKPSASAGFAATTTPTGAGVYVSHPGIPAGGGIREAGAVAGADGEDFRVTHTVPTGGSITYVTKYFTTTS